MFVELDMADCSIHTLATSKIMSDYCSWLLLIVKYYIWIL